MKVSVLIPILDTEPQLAETVARLRDACRGVDLEVLLVVDVPDPSREDASRAGNDEIAEGVGGRAIYRVGQRGFGSAIRVGFAEATGQAVIPYMGDACDDPADIPALVARMEAGWDVVAGSRYMPGGRIVGNTFKQRMSKLYCRLVRLVGGPPIHDVANAFKAYRRSVLDSVTTVAGLEVDAQRRSAIRLGKLPFHEPGAEEALGEAVTSGMLTVSDDPTQVVPSADIVVLCVGTPLAADLRPDYAQLRSALDRLAPHLRAGQLLIQRSTVSPGTLLKVVRPYLNERIPTVAEGLLIAACPERIAEGRAMEELASLPEIVGGVDDRSAEAAAALFRLLGPGKEVHVTDPTSAELAKLFTNVYRYVNFALANEFALLSEYYGRDAHGIIRMLNHGYPRADVPLPGPAGGPCLSKDGYFLVEELSLPDFVLMAWKLNDSAPAYVLRRLQGRLAEHGLGVAGTPVAVLGRRVGIDCWGVLDRPAFAAAGVVVSTFGVGERA